jgi:phytoene dehydrogenase-like protein
MTADVVVAGAGHDSLITAAYLTRAGHRCRVLDARPAAGGGVACEELLLPGQPVDSAGSGPLAYSIAFGRQRRSWTIPLGGSGELARALVEVIEQDGGEVLCG